MLDVALPAGSGPYAALSLIVAPAILTNASSLLVLSTSNRLARAVDLARELARELEASSDDPTQPGTTRRLREMTAANARSILLLRSLRAVYGALAGFATATLVSLLGAVFTDILPAASRLVVELVAMGAGLIAVACVVWAAALLVRETRIAVSTLGDRVNEQRARFEGSVT